MLVLSRRCGEAVIIGDEIQITVLAAHEDQDQVRIGITAPKAIEVHREEVYNQIHCLKQGVVITHKRRLRALVMEYPQTDSPTKSTSE